MLDFANPDPHAGVDVTLVEHRDLEAQIVIRRITQSPAGIEGTAGRATHIASGGVLPCQRGRDDAGVDGTILKRGGVVVEFDQVRESERGYCRAPHGCSLAPFRRDRDQPAGHDDVSHQAVTEGDVRRAENVLAQHVAVGLHQAEGRVVADRADVAEVVGEPLEFRQQRPQPDRRGGTASCRAASAARENA